MARRRSRKKNLGPVGKIALGVGAGIAAIYGLAWAGYHFKTKPKMAAPPAGTAALPGGEQADGSEGGFAWQVRYDESKPATPYSWKVTSPTGTVTKSGADTYANARAGITFAINLG